MTPRAPVQHTRDEDEDLRLMASRMLKLRQLRCRMFPKAFLGETAWEMLLVLYAQQGEPRLSMSRIAELTHTKEETASRWVDVLEAHRLVKREPAPREGRVALISLTNHAKANLETYLSQVFMTSP